MSLRMCALASGSKGNCCYVSDGRRDILVDLGVSARYAEKCLEALGVNPDSVDILVTHTHSDHVGGIKMFVKRHPLVRVHCQNECARAVFDITGVRPQLDGRTASIGDMTVSAIPVSHDVPCFGYVIRSGEAAIAVVTDIGIVGGAAFEMLFSCDIVMLEANHDTEMLKASDYPPQLKARIASAKGHLSNRDCAEACLALAQNGVKNFILAHLSEENNTPELAVSAVRSRLSLFGIEDVNITAAAQNAMTGLFEVC